MVNRRPSRANRLVITNRDIEIFKFIWRWKLVPTSAVHYRYFKGSTSEAAYRRLCKLYKGGWLQILGDPTRSWHGWSLTSKSFQTFKSKLPHMESECFRPDFPEHDLLVMRVLLGDWLIHAPTGAGILTEQEIRCVDSQYLPRFYPRDLDRRPDGYWHLGWENPPRVIALEVEISKKSPSQYESIADEYAWSKGIDHVVWVVGDKYILNLLQSQSTFVRDHRPGLYWYLRLEDVDKRGWDAVFVGQEKTGKTLRNLLHHRLITSPPPMDNRSIFNPHKSFAISASSKIVAEGEILNINAPTTHLHPPLQSSTASPPESATSSTPPMTPTTSNRSSF